MYSLVIGSHVIISTLLLVIAITRLFRSIGGWLKKYSYKILDHILNISFLILLYLQLISGVSLYFFFRSAKETALSVEEAIHNEEMRFWAIEHFSLMVFALIIMQIGQYFINHSTSDKKKFKLSTIFVGIVTVFILLSLALSK